VCAGVVVVVHAVMLAELDAFKRICTLMAAHGKVVTASLKGHFSNISDDQGQVHCPEGMSDDNVTECVPFGEEKVRWRLLLLLLLPSCCCCCSCCCCLAAALAAAAAAAAAAADGLIPQSHWQVFEVLGPTGGFIPHRQYNIPSRDFGDAAHGGSDADGCVAAIVDVSYAAAYGPTLITNNDGGPQLSEPSSKGGTFSPLAAHNTSLAAFLMAMDEGSYFGSG
jgi:hypothetical protein